MQGRKIAIRVFLEGIEVEVGVVSVQGGMDRPASLTIQLPTADSAHDLLPRTLVHVFYLETGHILEDPTDRTTPAAVADMMNRRHWRLLFAGEALGYGYANAGASRQISLHCQDFSSYWQQAKIYWGSGNLNHYTYKQATSAGAIQAFSGSNRVDNTDKLLNLLLAKPATIPRLTGVLGGLVALLETTTGVFNKNTKKQFRGVSDFMSQAELRLKLTHMIGAAADDDTSAKFIDSNAFRQYLRRLARSIGNTASFHDLVGVFLSRIYYGWSSLPAPPFFPGDERVRVKVAKERKIPSAIDPELRRDYQAINGLLTLVRKRTRTCRARNVFGGPVVDGVDTARYSSKSTTGPNDPNQQEDSAGWTGFARDAAVAQFLSRERVWSGRGAAFIERLRTDSQRDRYVTRVTSALVAASEMRPLLERIIRAGPGDYPEHRFRNLEELQGGLERAERQMRGLVGPATVTTLQEEDFEVGDRLNCHLFMPDLYMAPPPTCNVLFPDHYSSIQFSRDWMSEITRLVMHTRTSSGRDVKDMYFAPNTDIWGGPNATDVAEAIRKSVSFLMPHEKYTGPIVHMDAVGDVSIFRRIHEGVMKAEVKSDPNNPESRAKVSGEAAFSHLEHLRRASNYLFFAKRFSGRTIEIQARFSPQIVVGLPLLVLDPNASGFDRFSPTGDPDVDLARLGKGVHFIGTVAGLTHEINAAGSAITRISLTKCRAHTEGIDIFSDNPVDGFATVERTLVTRKARVRSRVRTKVTGTTEKTVGSYDTDMTVKYKDGKVATIAKDDALRAAGFTNGKGRRYTVVSIEALDGPDDIGPATPVGSYRGGGGTHDMSTVDDLVLPVAFEIKVVEETRVQRKTKKVDLAFSFEQTATPPWLAHIFYPHAIGKEFYQGMLGCGSILDASPLTATPVIGGESPERYEVNIPDEAGNPQLIELPKDLVEPSISIQQAAEKLGEAWLGLSRSGADMAQFIDAYTTRAYATIPDIMGDFNPLFWLNGRQLPPVDEDDRIPGLHGNAFGPYEGLLGYDGQPLQYAPLPDGVSGVATGVVDGRVDPRKARYERVLDYRSELIGEDLPSRS